MSLFGPKQSSSERFEVACQAAHRALDEWIAGETRIEGLPGRPPKYDKHAPVIQLGSKLSTAMIEAYNLRHALNRKPADPVDEFYSLPPKHRTKQRLRELIKESKF